MKTRLEEELRTAYQSHSSKPAVIIPETGIQYTYGELMIFTEQLSDKLLSMELPKRSAIALVMMNGIESITSLLAVILSGHIAVPLNPSSANAELSSLVASTCAAIVLYSGSDVPDDYFVVPLVLVKIQDGKLEIRIAPSFFQADTKFPTLHAPLDCALVLSTSGTTSKPKLVPLSADCSLLLAAKYFISAYELGLMDKVLLVMPLFHVHGLVGNLLPTLLSGGVAVIPRKFSASHFMIWSNRYKITWVSAVPTIYEILRKSPDQYIPLKHVAELKKSIRFIRSCSAPLSSSLYTFLKNTFGVRVIQAYGMTEAAHLLTTETIRSGCPGSVGKIPLDMRQFKVIGADNVGGLGEICVKGPGVIDRYLNVSKDSSNFTDDGYLRTGDLGHLDDNGYLFLKGRIKELINRGGEKISPWEVEAIIQELSFVHKVVCFASFDAIYGEQVSCAIVPNDHCVETSQELENLLSEHCQTRLAAFKCPTKIFIVNEIPTSSIGKVQRTFLSQFFNDLS